MITWIDGGYDLYEQEILKAFVEDLISSQKESPPEFEKIFLEHYKDFFA